MAGDRSLPYVDPHTQRGRLYRAYARLSGTRLGLWFSRHVMWKLDPVVMRLTRGQLGMALMVPTALLETRGARSGHIRRHPVIYFNDGDKVTIIATKIGLPENPAWYHNAVANPEVVFGGHPFRVEVVDDESERARLWALADNVFPLYSTYRDRAARAGRTVPILQLIAR